MEGIRLQPVILSKMLLLEQTCRELIRSQQSLKNVALDVEQKFEVRISQPSDRVRISQPRDREYRETTPTDNERGQVR